MNTPFIPEWVRSHARRSPDAPAIATPEARLSYSELAERFRVLAAHFAAAGVVAGDRVVVSLPKQRLWKPYARVFRAFRSSLFQKKPPANRLSRASRWVQQSG